MADFQIASDDFELTFRTPTRKEFFDFIDGENDPERRASARRNLVLACGGQAALDVASRWPALLQKFCAEIDEEVSGDALELVPFDAALVPGFTPSGSADALRCVNVHGSWWVVARPSSAPFESFRSAVADGKLASACLAMVVDCVKHPALADVNIAIDTMPGIPAMLAPKLQDLAGASMKLRKKKT